MLILMLPVFDYSGKQYGLNDGQWHTLRVEYSDWTLTISLDQCDVGLSLSHPQLFDYPCANRLEISKYVDMDIVYIELCAYPAMWLAFQ